MTRDMTSKGYAVTKSFEGRALKSYRDCVGVWTVGYGNTNYDAFAVQYLGRKIGPGITITEQEADYLLHESMRRKYLPQVVKAMGEDAPDAAVDAGGSFHYNTGAISRATWVKKWLGHQAYEAALESWNKGGGKVLAGLTRRRKREYAILARGDYGPEGRTAPPVLNASGHVVAGGVAPLPGAEPIASLPAEVVAEVIPTESPEHHLAGTPGMLRKGDEQPEVTDLQNLLVDAGFKVPVTGRFDDATDKAVRSFQDAHPQIGRDGVVGPATRTALQREVDMKRKLGTSTASTVTPTAGSAITDQMTGGNIPEWVWFAGGAVIVAVAGYFIWQYRDEIRGYLARAI